MRMRKKRHGNERLEALDALFLHSEGEIWTDVPSHYENDRPLRIEIGCGKGDFITGLSLRDTDYNYYAMELVDDDPSIC